MGDLENLVAAALAEDMGPGDLTTQSFVDPAAQAVANIVAKEDAVIAGIDVADLVFQMVDRNLKTNVLRKNGERAAKKDVVLSVHGKAASILTGERVALNFLQQLSGVATLTRQFVEAISGTKAQILDTRKTTPGLRALEKAAVVSGGGRNHRFGLFDMVMIKDNHLAMNERGLDLPARIREFRKQHPEIKVEVEADRLDQVADFLMIPEIDVILLDNMSRDQLTAAVEMRGDKPLKLEASGGVNLQTIRAIAETGVDFISIGALTHSARAMDFSLDLNRA